ncbi:unnamed protein product [Lymnaea stagnalis]|uniref:Uncharacterized protein n=1 Tax=Lymnaea stagnalis TaxID=6523 RepID=A0AAV2ICX6_LYMST
MVVAADKVAETVAVVPRPSYQETSVYSSLEISDHRRHREQVDFRPVLHPVRYADTAYIYLNNTKKRFVSRTFYEARVRPRTFSDTTFNYPKTADERYVSYLDFHNHENRKWFKTSIEIKARKFTSAQVLRSPNNNYLDVANTKTTTTTKSYISPGSKDLDPAGIPNSVGSNNLGRNLSVSSGRGRHGGGVEEKLDPGASQIYIPRPLNRSIDDQSLITGDLLLHFSNRKLDFNMNGPLPGYSDV